MFEMHADEVLGVLRDGRPRTKSELAEELGKVRSTISLRLAELIEAGLVTQLQGSTSTKGRAPAMFALATDARIIGAVALTSDSAVVALTDLIGTVLDRRDLEVPEDASLTDLVRLASATLLDLLDGLGRSAGDLVGIGVGVPGPVDPAESAVGEAQRPPANGRHPAVALLQQEFPVRVIVDNEANVATVGEWVESWAELENLIMVTVSARIDAGIIASAGLIRGADGGAGSIGHIRVPVDEPRLCRCGQLGCLETIASGSGLVQTLSSEGRDVHTTDDVVALVRSGDPAAVLAVREAGRALGTVLAGVAATLNPSAIVLGGDVAQVGEPLLAGIREAVYGLSQPLTTNSLRIAIARNLELASIVGASRLVQNSLFGVPRRPVVYYRPEPTPARAYART
ncbi:ROK family transcriptional regulator [Demequina capsici]|uniref:ROK family transcriptional regulator n=1 Tax=Demequina capsici TaxID=3075620 RepID=A0AA96F6F2_9MICO|nr:ROK family transcriptional regulator [Demequina sp. OYTSA14]WNM23590.1 ROK family transcriptional regulator [Demequina sp. OYTSA14]